MAGRRVHFVMSDDLVSRIDAACSEGVSRGEFVRRAAEQALSEAKEPPLEGRRPTSGSIPSSEGARSAAPAEQPLVVPSEMRGPRNQYVENVRSSSQSKRDVRPIPKKGER